MADIKNLSDVELLILVKKDNEAAFTEIYNRYAQTLAEFAGAKLYSLEDARDLLHDLFVKLWEDRHLLMITTNLKGYLYAAVRYKVIDKIRQNSTRYLEHLFCGWDYQFYTERKLYVQEQILPANIHTWIQL